MFQSDDGIMILEAADFILVPVYLFFIYLFVLLIRSVSMRNSPLARYFIPGLTVKILGGIGVGVVYGFYYRSGDTFYYFNDSLAFTLAVKDGLGQFFNLLTLPSGVITIYTNDYTNWLCYFHDPAGWTADKVYGILSILTFHSYWTMSVVISALSFSGAWALYRTFARLYPHLYHQLAICVLFVPSVFFWGSGVLKDSITFGCLGWITFTSYQIFFRQKSVFTNSIILFCTAWLALKIKAYIVISFAPALLFWIFLTYRSRIQVKFARIMSGPLIFTLSIFFGYLMVSRLGDEFRQFSLQNVLTTSQNFQIWHSYLAEHENASGYSLGNIDGSWQSILMAAPRAVAVTLFQPFLWQAHSIVVLTSALESTFVLCFTIYIFWKNGFKRVILSVWQNPNIFFCFFFSILFAFCVGFTAYNFGALVRYKIPCIPFYLIGMVILNDLTSKERKELAEKMSKDREARKYKRTFAPPAPVVG